MAAKAPPPPPLSRLSRIGRAFGINPHEPEPQHDDWYIPYNGPYEAPSSRPRTSISSDWNSVFGRINEHPSSRGSAFGEDLLRGGPRKRASSIVSVSTSQRLPHKHSSIVTVPKSPPPSFRHQAGSIGDTPVPRQRTTSGNFARRLSLASFLTFGSSAKKQPSPPTHVVQIRHDVPEQASTSSHGMHHSISSQHHELKPSVRGSKPDDLSHSDSSSTNHTPAITTYQSTPPRSQSKPPSPSMPHPYGTAFPIFQPAVKSKGKDRVTFTGHKAIPSHLKPSSRTSLLKASISTPNLHSLHKGRSYWLSAETWCDALFLPRPRFMIRNVDGDDPIGGSRLVSLPGTPLPPEFGAYNHDDSLRKAKSVVDLQTSNFATIPSTRVVRDTNEATSGSEMLRTRSFAFDDLAIPSPVPSLATVLAAGQHLQDERSAWRKQAVGSMYNKRSRSLSRARSKSQGNSKKPNSDTVKFDFLAALTLGSQPIAPIVVVDSRVTSSRSGTNSGSTGLGTFSFGSTAQTRSRSKSHSHSNSLGTLGQGHARNKSFRTILRKKRPGTASSAQEAPLYGCRNDSAILEDALKDGKTQLTYLPNWTGTPGQSGSSANAPGGLNSTSPTPSGFTASGEGIGLAFSSPPPSDDHSRPSYEEPIRIPTHPYANGATYSYTPPPVCAQSSLENAPKYSRADVVNVHRQPITRPYASHGGHLSPVVQERSVSPSKKMFAQFPSGQVREILPGEIQYSPLMVNERGWNGSKSLPRTGDAKRRSDTLHMGEVLSMTLRSNRGSPDSGIGASADRHPFGPAPTPVVVPQTTKPVQKRPVGPPPLEYPDDPSVLPRWNTEQGSSRPGPSRILKNSLETPRNLSASPFGNIHPFPPSGTLLSPVSPVSSYARSYDSSPPVSLGSLGRLDDFERFHDLFYRPKLESGSPSIELENQRKALSKGVAETIDTNQNADRSASTVRQLEDDLTESNGDKLGATGDVMWGGRFGGLKGDRFTDTLDPNTVLQRSRSLSALSTLPLRVRVDTSLESTGQSFTTDVGDEQVAVDGLRLGTVDVVTTPPPVCSIRRNSSSARVSQIDLSSIRHNSSSAHVSQIDLAGDNERERVTSPAGMSLRIPAPLTGVVRSSYMTNYSNNSRISGLSDFPRPPSETTLDASYFGTPPQDVDSQALPYPPPPPDWRESFRATFGGKVDADVPYP